MASTGPSERIVLEQLAQLVPESDEKRRKVLTNLDRIAQGALDAVRSYTNKHGEELTVAQPDWNVAVKAMESARGLLGLDAEPDAKAHGAASQDPDGPIVKAIRSEGDKVRLVK